MIAHVSGLLNPAEEAKIETPNREELEKFIAGDAETVAKYLRFQLFCYAQLGQPMPNPSAHFQNAMVIAGIPEDEIKTITAAQLKERGFQIGFSNH